MATLDDGAGGGSKMTVDATHKAGRVSIRPAEALGYYRVGVPSGNVTGVGVVANAPLFSMRWTDATKLCAIWNIRVSLLATTAFTAAQELSLGVIMARGFTASDSAGTAISLSGNNAKKRTSMATSVMGDMRVAAATLLTAGTRTLDSNYMTVFPCYGGGAAGQLLSGAEWKVDNGSGNAHPIILAQNEGLIIANLVAYPAAGVGKYYFEIDWSEHSAF